MSTQVFITIVKINPTFPSTLRTRESWFCVALISTGEKADGYIA